MNSTQFNAPDVILSVIQILFRGNIPLYKEMVNLFFETVNEKLETIKHAIKREDQEKIRFSAHFIKGGASNLGADIISQISNKMESLEENNIIIQTEKLLPELHLEINKFSEFVGQIN